MKISRLYIKIFLSFVCVLIVTMIVIFLLFLRFSGREFKTRFEQYTAAKVLMVKEVVEDKIRLAPNLELTENQPLKKFIGQLGQILSAQVWLQGTDGIFPIKSFDGPIPTELKGLTRKPAKDFGSFKLYHGFRKRFSFYAIVPVEFPGGEAGSVHVLFAKGGPTDHEGSFAFALTIIGLIIAVLVIPVSRFITKPLKELNHTALRIAQGDLSHRAHVKSCDEIGELGQSFNNMADKLERLIRGGRELTANISHELRTPLTRIRIAEELLREKMAKGSLSGWERHLNDIREDIEELDSLIGQILDLSKLDIHEKTVKHEKIDLQEMIAEIMERLQQTIDHRGLSVETDLALKTPFWGDGKALQMALSNVLHNAVKFTPAGGGVRIRGTVSEDVIQIAVTNTSKSLSEEDLEKIFEPFHRVQGSRAEGTGLGLAITKKIIEKHGGEITATNAPDGLEIKIFLPHDGR